MLKNITNNREYTMVVPIVSVGYENFVKYIYDHSSEQDLRMIYRLYDSKKIRHAASHVWHLLFQHKTTNVAQALQSTYARTPVIFFDTRPKEV